VCAGVGGGGRWGEGRREVLRDVTRCFVADMHNMGILPPIEALLGREGYREVEKWKGKMGYGLKVR